MGVFDRLLRSPKGPDPAPPPAPAESSSRVRHPAEIGRLLQLVQEHRTPLSVDVPGQDEAFVTAVLDVDRQARVLHLDELNRPVGHQAFVKAGSLRATGYLDGVRIGFETTLAEVARRDGMAYYVVPFPEVMDYVQRRKAHRVAVHKAIGATLVISHPSGHRLVGQLTDLSVGGLGARLRLPFQLGLSVGQRFEHCALELPDHPALPCALELRFVSRPSSGPVRVGARLVGLERKDEHQVAQFVAHLERQALKLRPGKDRDD